MNELNKLRDRISYGIVGLLWINFALIVIRNLVREQGVDWTMILATLALLVPATLLWTRDRTGATTRMVTSMANAATVAILVFAFQGSPLQIDIHMYFFASLAICAAWIDWKAIIGYAALVAVHHLLLYVAMPLAVFPGDSDFSRVVLHAVVLIVQSIVLIALTSAVVKAFDVSDKAVAEAVAAEREAVEMADHVKRTDAAADADRRKREAEKAREAEAVDYAVSELAKSLQKLAEGDLSCRIDSAFSGPLDGTAHVLQYLRAEARSRRFSGRSGGLRPPQRYGPDRPGQQRPLRPQRAPGRVGRGNRERSVQRDGHCKGNRVCRGFGR